jgi:hypothetical protein
MAESLLRSAGQPDRQKETDSCKRVNNPRVTAGADALAQGSRSGYRLAVITGRIDSVSGEKGTFLFPPPFKSASRLSVQPVFIHV